MQGGRSSPPPRDGAGPHPAHAGLGSRPSPHPRAPAELSSFMNIVSPYMDAHKAGAARIATMEPPPARATDRMEMGIPSPAQPRVSNSTSSIYVTSTVSKPNTIEVLQAISSVLHCIIHQGSIGHQEPAPMASSAIQVFDERIYVPAQTGKRLKWSQDSEGVPPPEIVFRFLKSCVDRASFSSECMVIALILLNRLLAVSSVPIVVHAYNWRLFFLTSILLAQKIWDDVSLANTDFPIVWRHATQIADYSLDALAFCQMESTMLELLSFNLFISTSLYTQYIFELRSVYEAEFSTAFPINAQPPAFLESRSSSSGDTMRANIMLPSRSAMDVGQRMVNRSRAVLS